MATALFIVAVSMWHMTSLDGNVDFGFFAWARVFQMMSLPFLFIPINTVSYDGLPGEKTNQASALINVARNLGGSIGVSLANTLLVQRAQFHQARLAEHIIPSSLNYQTGLQRVINGFIAEGDTPAQAQHHAVGWIGQLIETQSTLMSYIDVFYASALFALCMIPVALLLRPVKRRGGQAPAMGH
jgi:DHA2 family multidrug resistance protein